MPARRDADGNIIDELTTPAWQSDRAGPSGLGRGPAVPTEPMDFPGGAAPTAPRGEDRDADRHRSPTVPHRAGSGAGAHTTLYRPGRPEPEPAGADPADPMADPPVGWLVIVDGPGKGHVATLGMGVNAIGRDRTERVPLDYGDQMISRVNHGTITYDPRGRKFYVTHGGGTNLTYVDDEPVLAPRELAPLTHLQMGKTVLRFVPLCGAEFSWDDKSNADDS